MINNRSEEDYAVVIRILTSISVDEILLSRYVIWSTN